MPMNISSHSKVFIYDALYEEHYIHSPANVCTYGEIPTLYVCTPQSVCVYMGLCAYIKSLCWSPYSKPPSWHRFFQQCNKTVINSVPKVVRQCVYVTAATQ